MNCVHCVCHEMSDQRVLDLRAILLFLEEDRRYFETILCLFQAQYLGGLNRVRSIGLTVRHRDGMLTVRIDHLLRIHRGVGALGPTNL